MNGRPKLLLFVSVDWFFCSHFADRAIAAARDGFDVVVVTNVTEHRKKIEAAGLKVIHLALDRKSLNPFFTFAALVKLRRILWAERPDIVHNVALKPIVLGTLAALLHGRSLVVNAVVGGGFIFTYQGPFAPLLRNSIGLVLGFLLNPRHSRVVFENRDDLQDFVKMGYVKIQEAVLIRGAGVDLQKYTIGDVAAPIPLIILPARLLWDKGVGEFVEAAKLLINNGVRARFAVVGGPDNGNRAAIDEMTLDQWKQEGLVEFWGFRSDMEAVLAQASIMCLPSYREGLPKALLEGMAAGLPCVTTDVPGCREAVIDGFNGVLVAPRDHVSLAEALRTIIDDVQARVIMGANGRSMATAEFSTELVTQRTLAVYHELLDQKRSY